METAKKILIEVVSVVFAVLLALGLNHWRESNAEKELAERALKNVVIEIRDNIETLENDADDYVARIDTLKITRKRMEAGEVDDFDFGYTCPVLSNSAWKVANSTAAVKDMNLEIVMNLSEIYIFQDMFQDNGFSFFKIVSSPGFQEGNRMTGLRSLSTQLVISQQFSISLKEAYEEFLEEYKDQLPAIQETQR